MEKDAQKDVSIINLLQPNTLEMGDLPSVEAVEGNPFKLQPSVKMTNEYGKVVPILGSSSRPWKVQAKLSPDSPSHATLLGNTTVTFNKGYAQFDDLAILGVGEYKLLFEVISPKEASGFKLKSSTIQVCRFFLV